MRRGRKPDPTSPTPHRPHPGDLVEPGPLSSSELAGEALAGIGEAPWTKSSRRLVAVIAGWANQSLDAAMLLEAPALGALGVATDVPEDTSILRQGYVEPRSPGEEVRSQLLIR